MAAVLRGAATVTATAETIGGGPQFADMAATIVAGASLTATALVPAPTYFGGGSNADREWYEELERKESEARKEAAEKAAKSHRASSPTAELVRAPSDALMVFSKRAPAPLVRRGVSPAVAFARLADYLTAWAAERDRLAAEEVERQAVAFALEQQRIAEEAAALQLALDDEAAEALMALLMHA
jgi:hypothetical protein